jgi:hypothetical protein
VNPVRLRRGGAPKLVVDAVVGRTIQWFLSMSASLGFALILQRAATAMILQL